MSHYSVQIKDRVPLGLLSASMDNDPKRDPHPGLDASIVLSSAHPDILVAKREQAHLEVFVDPAHVISWEHMNSARLPYL